MKKNAPFTAEYIENILFHLNYRWMLNAIAVWQGNHPPIDPSMMYEGYEDFLASDIPSIIEEVDLNDSPMGMKEAEKRHRLKHAFIDHCLQMTVLPHETEMRTWMKGAAADVHDEKVYMREIIPWCQKKSTAETRRILQKEVSALCKFLKPFALNYWGVLLESLESRFGFKNYLEYCEDKKSINYAHYRGMMEDILERTKYAYLSAMDKWAMKSMNTPLHALTRFDSLPLLGMFEFDSQLPIKEIHSITRFFLNWNIDIDHVPGLHLDLSLDGKKNAQAICFILQVPDEVYVMMKPQGGWIDIETIFHELGHGLFASFSAPSKGCVERDMPTSRILSETYAFLLQNMVMSMPFMTDFLGIDEKTALDLRYHKILRDISIFRRYGAKFLSEYEMFSKEDLADGSIYSEKMTEHTGFYYQPEAALFDLVPEFYCLDYIIAWMAEAVLENYLQRKMGDRWMFQPETGELFREWWAMGEALNIFEFFEGAGIGKISPDPLMDRWNKILKGQG